MRTGWRSARGRICLIKTFADVPYIDVLATRAQHGRFVVRTICKGLHAFRSDRGCRARTRAPRVAPSGDGALVTRCGAAYTFVTATCAAIGMAIATSALR